MAISAAEFISVYSWLFVFLRLGFAQDVSNTTQMEDFHVLSRRSPIPESAAAPPPAIHHSYIRLQRATSNGLTSSCSAPPQPANGEWKLDTNWCESDNTECNVSEGTAFVPGTQLIYRCNQGYKANGATDVYCRLRGKWSPIPDCIEVRCNSLNSVSTIVECTYFGNWVNCDSPVLPGTRAEVTCRRGYKKDTDFVTARRGVVDCNVDGHWRPNPIRCVPVCGLAVTNQKPLVFGGTPTTVGEFPWHASLYMLENSRTGYRKGFRCGATIIQINLVMTAAHCVYDETTRTTADPGKLFVATGNVFRDYDSPDHNPEVVRKAAVKHVYTHCNYYGLTGNYASDIALLQLQQPFEFSSILRPACLDDSGYSEQFLESGVYGKVAGFGKASVHEKSSNILQTLTMPYISYGQCKTSNKDSQTEAFISNDKFCAGYNNGSAVCDGDSGGGLVFKKGELWYVMGIVSVSLGVDIDNGDRTCDRYAYTLFTKVSTYMSWIQNLLVYLEDNREYPSCSHTRPSMPTSAMPDPTGTLLTDDTVTPLMGDGRGAIARQKCMEYSQYVNTSKCPRNLPFNDWGKQPIGIRGTTGKTKAAPMEFPHMAAVGFIKEAGDIAWYCGGTLISEIYVLTVAHCTYSLLLGNATWVRVGDLNLVRSDEGATPEDRRIAERIRHPEYKLPASYHNIALLRLETRVPFNDWIRPACLHTESSVGTQEAVATGWGRLNWLDEEGSNDLMKVTLPLVDAETCNATWTTGGIDRAVPKGIVEDWLICAGAEGKDTCQGDSGGPLVIFSKPKYRCMYDLVGITSNGKLCGSSIPGLYTRVYNYVPWIESIVWGQG